MTLRYPWRHNLFDQLSLILHQEDARKQSGKELRADEVMINISREAYIQIAKLAIKQLETEIRVEQEIDRENFKMQSKLDSITKSTVPVLKDKL